MNFLSMDYFVMLAKEQNFTRAAAKLHITQQTLSAHIAALEKEAGTALFLRHVPLELTYAGKIFLRYAEGFRQNLRSLQNELNDVTCNEAGELRIGTTPFREKALLPELITQFQAEHPRIHFHLIEASNQVLQEKLLNGEIDLAIANFSKRLPGIELTDYYEEEIILLVSRELFARSELAAQWPGSTSPVITTDELRTIISAFPFLLNAKDTIMGNIFWQFFAENEIFPLVKIESSNIETLLRLCYLGSGAMLCPDNIARQSLSGQQLEQMKQFRLPQLRYSLSLGRRKETHSWSVLTSFIQTALSHKPAVL